MQLPKAESKWLPALFGTACGIIVANLYYTQPVAGLISTALGLPKQNAGLLTTLPLIGYGAGLLMIVPLGDLIENRRLGVVVGGSGSALPASHQCCPLSPSVFLSLGFLIGVTAAVVPGARSIQHLSRAGRSAWQDIRAGRQRLDARYHACSSRRRLDCRSGRPGA